MERLWELLNEARSEIIGGLVVAAVFAIIKLVFGISISILAIIMATVGEGTHLYHVGKSLEPHPGRTGGRA